jgi:glycosyltransferase involved in cell wall biosynthesis|tara:strand:- start:97 stop:708 length:612 start_codon:yes stop_codon:yes gene_type:complete
MDNISFAIITPTFNRSSDVLERCFASIDAQIYKNWKQIVIIDDDNIEKHISSKLVEKYSCDNREFICLGKNSNDFGNSPRTLGIKMASQESYIVFIDDDNVIFPDYLSSFAKNIQLMPIKKIHICQIIHLGPLPSNLGTPPKIIYGKPPVLRNIDTLQICVAAEIIKQHGWLDMGYLADGYTIQSICKTLNYTYINKVLGVHM